jgi:hypothetical protein
LERGPEGDLEAAQNGRTGRKGKGKGKICGLKKKVFWVTLMVGLVVVTGAVGGAGGYYAGKRRGRSQQGRYAAWTGTGYGDRYR